jgi:outer membrane protein assembly factor BamE (lipoprotein component of BamABCDE complex)
MVGMSKEQVLQCMGPPAQTSAEGQTEVWSYASGNGRTDVSTFGNSTTSGSLVASGNYASGYANTALFHRGGKLRPKRVFAFRVKEVRLAF